MDVNSTGVWRRHCLVPVQYLSDIPAIQPAIFDGLRGKGVITQHRLRINQRTGRYILRVVARNQAGVGPGNTVLVDFEDGKGWCENIQFKPKSYSVGGVSFEELPEVEAVQRTYCTHWAEKIFISDQGDYDTSCHCVQVYINQDHNSIRLAVRIGLEEVRKNRRVETMRVVTDTGGENWGNQVIYSKFTLYSF